MPAPPSPWRWPSPRSTGAHTIDSHRDPRLRPRVSAMAIGQLGQDAISQLERQQGATTQASGRPKFLPWSLNMECPAAGLGGEAILTIVNIEKGATAIPI